MKLSNIFPQIKTDNKIQAKRVADGNGAKAGGQGSVLPADRVDLSASSQDVQKARQVLENTPSVRAERVQALKAQIERGEYEVDPYKVADKMLLSLLSDNILSD